MLEMGFIPSFSLGHFYWVPFSPGLGAEYLAFLLINIFITIKNYHV